MGFKQTSIILMVLASMQLCAEWSLPVQISREPAMVTTDTLMQDPPVQISPGPALINPIGNALVVNSCSVATVVWMDGTQVGTSHLLLSASLFPNADDWNAPIPIVNDPNRVFTPGIVALDACDRQVTGFGSLNQSGQFAINAARRATASDPWGPSINGPSLNGFPQAGSESSDRCGNLVTILAMSPDSQAPTPTQNIILQRLLACQDAWSPTIQLGTDLGTNPMVATRIVNGKGIAVWQDRTGSIPVLKSVRYDVATGQTFAISDLPLTGPRSVGLMVDMNCHGDIVLLFGVQMNTQNPLYITTLLAGETTWSTPMLVTAPGNSVTMGQLVMNNCGTATMIWGEVISPTQQVVRATTLPLSGTINPAEIVNLTDPTLQNTVVSPQGEMAIDSFGNVAAVWSISINSAGPFVQFAAKAACGAWQPTETLGTIMVDGTPLVALGDQGTAVAAWVDGASGLLVGRRNRYLFPLTPPCGFTGGVLCNQFLTQKTQSLNLRWGKSPAPHIVQYLIMRQGQVVATVPGDKLCFALHQFCSPCKSGSYSLVAVASNGNRSTPVSLRMTATKK